MVILDGAAVVNMIKPRTPVSFDWYVTQVMEYTQTVPWCRAASGYGV